MLKSSVKCVLLVCILIFYSHHARAQKRITTIEEDIERKISLRPFVGLAVFPNTISYNDIGAPLNLFEGFTPAPMFGISAYYKLKKRITIGAEGNFLLTQRPLNTMNAAGVGLNLKFNFLNPKRRVNPYILAGLNVSFINLNRKDQSLIFYPADTGAVISGFNAREVRQNYNQLDLTMAPMIGPVAGAGIDIRISRKISVFVQGNINTHFGTNALIKSVFPENQSVLQYISFRGGINIKLFRKMKFDIDSEAVKVPDMIVQLLAPEDQEQQQQMLGREANFEINIREGLRHNVQISTSNGEINIDMDRDTTKSPCPVKAILYDEFGNKVAEQIPGPDGKVNFGNLGKGVFNVAFEVQPPCKESAFSYNVTDPNSVIQKQHNSEYALSKDSLSYNIDGFVDFKDPNSSKENVQVMLVDQNNKKIKAKQVTKSDGGFAFKNLAPGNYKVVYDVGNPNVQSKIAYDVKTNSDSLVKKVDFPFNEVKSVNKEGSRLMAGKIEMTDPSVAAYKVNLDLVDKYNRVIDKSVPSKDGTFEFIDKQSDQNDIVYDLQDKKLQNEAVSVKAMTYTPKVEEAKKIEAKQAAAIATSGLKPELAKADEMEMYKLYNREGKAVNVEGFGYQVGAFRNMLNVNQLMDRLRASGYEVYVQAVWSNDINSRFKSSQNYKFHRVIVYGSNEDLKANQVRTKLLEEGHTIIVKEHFKPSVQTNPSSSPAANIKN